MRILVTGGTGFTGSHLVRRLIRDGHDVIAVDNQKGLFWDELQALGAQLHLASVTDRDRMQEFCQGCDIVFHLAAAFRKVNLPKSAYWNINVEGTRYLLEAARQSGVVKFVYCSTCGVHGNVDNPPAAEDAPIKPEDYYQYTKWEGERAAHEFIRLGMDVTVIRPAATYGPGDPERFFMLFKRVATGRFTMFGDGRTTYHPLYIDNLIDAFILAATVPESKGQTYLIADEHYYSLNDLVRAVADALGVQVRITHLPFAPLWLSAVLCEMVCKPLGVSPPLFRRRVDWFRQNRAFDISKARRELGYQPKVDLPTGLRETARWYRQMGYLPHTVQDAVSPAPD
ncbi:MAG: NAD-dependent epimerase/dehydratase family protein [Armatimonadota bacterium]